MMIKKNVTEILIFFYICLFSFIKAQVPIIIKYNYSTNSAKLTEEGAAQKQNYIVDFSNGDITKILNYLKIEVISNDSNQENSSKNSSMTEIKNMFDINNNSNSNESNIFHNSVKIFKKRNLTTNPESSLNRKKSNKHITEQNLINNKNFPEKANYYKGNTNNN